MSEDNKENGNAKQQKDNTNGNDDKKAIRNAKPVKSKNIFQRHPFIFILLIALIISIIWGTLKANRIENNLTAAHKKEMQAERELLGKTLVNTMSLTLRSELTRDNKEQAEQYMVEFVKSDLNVTQVSFMDQSSKEIVFSTDKSVESRIIEDEFILNTKEPSVRSTDTGLLLTAPVTGLSKQLGVLFIHWDFKD
jgi:hypothetical protein